MKNLLSQHYFRERNSHPIRLFNVENIPGVNQFLPLPHGVPELSWPIQLSEEGIEDLRLKKILKNIISKEAEVYENE